MVSTRFSGFLHEFKEMLQHLNENDVMDVAKFVEFVEKKRRAYITRYYQRWDPSALECAKEKRHGLHVTEDPTVAVTTLSLPVSACLRFPDVEANYEGLKGLFTSARDQPIYVRATLEVLDPSRAHLLKEPSLEEPSFKNPVHNLSLMEYYLSTLFNPRMDRMFYDAKVPRSESLVNH